MVSAIAGAYRPNGVSAHGVLVFQGEQYVGKTKWFKNLVPAELDVLKDGLILRPDSRDSIMLCVSNWLVELGELDATFRKADIAALKSWLTKDRDELRRAYDRRESHYPRRTVFFASVNPKNYLHDDTGNRRYWTIEVDSLDYDHGLDMQQVWAQVLKLYKDGVSWYLTNDEFVALNSHNSEFESGDPVYDLLTGGLDWSSESIFWTWRTATEILMELGLRTPTKSDVTKAAMIMRKINGNKSKRESGDSRTRLLLSPPFNKTRI
jgi:putative DNA primase/helicase